MAEDIASGMLYIHKSEMQHRDLKLENVLVITMDEDSKVQRCKIIDFGITRPNTE